MRVRGPSRPDSPDRVSCRRHATCPTPTAPRISHPARRRCPTPPSRPGLLRSIAHRLAGDPHASAGRRAPPVVRWRDGLAQLGAADAGGTSRTRRPRRLLDLHLRQLAAHAAVRPGLGGEVPRRRPDGRRRPHARVRLRAKRRQRRRAVARLSASSTRSRVDSDYGVWRAFANHFWPAVYIADAEGRIRYHHFGEGEYADDRDGDPAAAARRRRATTSIRTWSRSSLAGSRSPPTGGRCSRPRPTSAMARAPASRRTTSRRFDEPHAYAAPARLPLNDWALSGTGRWPGTPRS